MCSKLKALLFVPVPTRGRVGWGYAWRLQKTNKQTIACPDVFMMIAKYTDAFSFFDDKKSLVVTRMYFEHDPGSVRHFDFSSSLMAICVARLKIC